LKAPDFFPAIIWLLACTVLLSLPGDMIGGSSRIPYFDKWVHIGLFGALNFLWLLPLLLYKPGKRAGLLLVSLGVVIYGLLMEFFQLYCIPNRSFELADVLADATGVLLALLFSGTKWGDRVVKKIGPDRNRDRNQN
jgi:VanZ family protein